MNLESLTNLARPAKEPGTPKKSQEELRADLESKLTVLKSPLEQGVKEYQQAFESGLFDDQDDEPEGSGEKRKEEMQKKLTAMLDRAERMKAKLDSRETLPQYQNEIKVEYTYTNPKTHKVEKQESIALNIESKLQDFLSFYQKTDIDLPPNFEEAIRDVWEQNTAEIQEAIEHNGFDELLIIPPTPNIEDLSEKMKMGKGYYENENFKSGGSFAGAVSQNVDKPRIILVHKTKELIDRPELAKTLNIKGKDVKLDQTLTLEDYLVFQRKYYEETNKHLDEDCWPWLATKSGARLVDSHWNPYGGLLNVNANDLDSQDDFLGARPSRSFF